MAEKSNEVLDTIMRRRTVRKFIKKDVPQEVIDQLVQAALYAPTRLGKRPWHFILISDAKVKESLASVLKLHPVVAEAPAVIAICGNRNASTTWNLDCAAAAENILIAAASLGLGAAWIGGHSTALWEAVDSVFAEAVCSPAEIGLLSLIAIGYASEELPAHTEKDVWNPNRVHYEKWEAMPL
jgi:nitroreductase